MTTSASELWANICRLLDQVLETGRPLEIVRKGVGLRIVAVDHPRRMDRLIRHDCIKGDLESLVHMDWSGEWHGDLCQSCLVATETSAIPR